MPNTNSQTILQMPGIVNKMVKQATGRESVGNIDMNFVTVGQDKATVHHTIEFTSEATFVNNNQLPMSVIAKIKAVQEGTGDPTPANIRPITGWTGVTVTHTGENTENTYAITFPENTGTVYGGELNVTTGLLTIDKFLYVYDGTESFFKSGSALNGFFNKLTDATPHDDWPLMFNYTNAQSLTDEAASFLICTISSTTYKDNYGYCYIDSGHNFNVDPDIFGTTVDSFKAKLAELYAAETPLSVFCRIATPITVQLTPTEIDSFIGENNLYADTGNIAVSYTSYIPVP